jgi:quercetin dioxygenase-like cupin family protein
MKRLLVVSALSLTAALLGAAENSNVTFIGHDQVAKGGSLATASDLSVIMIHRTSRGEAEIHDKETDTFYVVAGTATIVTGGTMIGGKVTAPGQQRGADISGGQAQQITKGDVMVIPAGVPHWFKEVPESIDYYVVKVIKP